MFEISICRISRLGTPLEMPQRNREVEKALDDYQRNREERKGGIKDWPRNSCHVTLLLRRLRS